MLDHLFRATVTWLAPMLPFTAEEAWLARYPSSDGSVHLELLPRTAVAAGATTRWRRNGARCATCAASSPARSRSSARISASAPRSRPRPSSIVSDPDLFAALVDVDLAEVAITSAATLVEGEGPPEAFRLDDVKGVAVEVRLARGKEVRALMEDPAQRRLRSGLSRRLPARRPGAARVGGRCARRRSEQVAEAGPSTFRPRAAPFFGGR